jgi:UDP-N-acetylmuramate dehydrogenase
MMAGLQTTGGLLSRLPEVRGRYREMADLAATTWFRVGGPAEVLFRPADAEDLAQFLSECPADVPVTVIGVGSNLLVRDGGIHGAGALVSVLAKAAAGAGIAGLEFFAGIPGTLGGALRMNAGAYGRETKDVVVSATALSPDGTQHVLGPAELGFSYRASAVASDWIFTQAVLTGAEGSPDEINRAIAKIQEDRAETQPVRSRTGGSTFRNPGGPDGEPKAWELIDEAGCRGLTFGGAEVSRQHCNFLINTGSASAADLEALGEEVRRRVKKTCGVTLEWEIRRLGAPAGSGPASIRGAVQ